MIIALSTSGPARSHWYEYAIRFVLGGLVTSGAELLAKEFGPSFAGLFLAFPAILPASVTLIEKHEREQKEKKLCKVFIGAGTRPQLTVPVL
jgi:hypothetical protein